VSPTEDLLLRPGTRDDLPAVADLHLRARAAAVPSMPPLPEGHGRAEVLAYVTGWDLARSELWLAERDGVLRGYAMVQDDWLHSLYVDPGVQGRGIGSALLDLTRSLRPDGFCLYVFESNEPARAFYRRHGLLELERTDGSGNMEHAPDVRMAWPGRDPLAFLRGLIDEVDDEMGHLLARRAALTAAVQQVKEELPGGADRDSDREAEIVRRLARHAPALGETRLARILDVVVAESLDAAEG
jgi:ribosomal protein S18 acetylase RimI-like enzyme/chorismate mutase